MKTFVILITVVACTLAAPFNEQWSVNPQPSWSSRSSEPDFELARATIQGNQNAARTMQNQPINPQLVARSNARPQLHHDHVELSGLHDGIPVHLPKVHSNQNEEKTVPWSLPESHRNFQKSINIASDAMDNIESGLGANSDSTLHHSIKTAKQALKLVQQGFTNIGDLESSATSADSVLTLKSIDEEKKRMNQWKQTIENIQAKNVVPMIEKSVDAVEIKKDDNALNALEQHENKDDKIVENKKDQIIVTENQKKIEENVEVDKIQKVDTVKQESDNVANDKLESKTETKLIEKPAIDMESSASAVSSVAVEQVNVPEKIMHNVSEKKSEQIEEELPGAVKSSEVQSKNSANVPMAPKHLSEEDLQLNATKTENKELKMANADQSAKASMQWAHHSNPMTRGMMPHNWARSAYGAESGLPHLGGLPSRVGGGSAIGVFPHGQHSNCAIPILLSCSPSVVSGSLSKYHSTGYGAPSYRNQD